MAIIWSPFIYQVTILSRNIKQCICTYFHFYLYDLFCSRHWHFAKTSNFQRITASSQFKLFIYKLFNSGDNKKVRRYFCRIEVVGVICIIESLTQMYQRDTNDECTTRAPYSIWCMHAGAKNSNRDWWKINWTYSFLWHLFRILRRFLPSLCPCCIACTQLALEHPLVFTGSLAQLENRIQLTDRSCSTINVASTCINVHQLQLECTSTPIKI